jgi:hypothetical protein
MFMRTPKGTRQSSVSITGEAEILETPPRSHYSDLVVITFICEARLGYICNQ